MHEEEQLLTMKFYFRVFICIKKVDFFTSFGVGLEIHVVIITITPLQSWETCIRVSCRPPRIVRGLFRISIYIYKIRHSASGQKRGGCRKRSKRNRSGSPGACRARLYIAISDGGAKEDLRRYNWRLGDRGTRRQTPDGHTFQLTDIVLLSYECSRFVRGNRLPYK